MDEPAKSLVDAADAMRSALAAYESAAMGSPLTEFDAALLLLQTAVHHNPGDSALRWIDRTIRGYVDNGWLYWMGRGPYASISEEGWAVRAAIKWLEAKAGAA